MLSQQQLPTPIGQFGFLERPHLDLKSAANDLPEEQVDKNFVASAANNALAATAHLQKRLAQLLR